MTAQEATAQDQQRHANASCDAQSMPCASPVRLTLSTQTEELSEILSRHGFAFLLGHPRFSGDGEVFPLSGGEQPARGDIHPQCVTRYAAMKRLGDIVLASGALLLLLPVMTLICMSILLEDGYPFFYHQLRAGYQGNAFRFFKFRSMCVNAGDMKAALHADNQAEGPIFKIRRDPRITRVGRLIRKFSLDELPQLVNVLRGEMSIVGPRPLYQPEAERLSAQHRVRHDVQPGLLCFREVCGRSDLSFEQWMDLDLIYVRTRSIKTDIAIILRAVPAILSAKGAY